MANYPISEAEVMKTLRRNAVRDPLIAQVLKAAEWETAAARMKAQVDAMSNMGEVEVAEEEGEDDEPTPVAPTEAT